MEKLQITARFKLHRGRTNDFKTLAKEALVITKEKDKGVIQYDWFFNEDETECVVRETYKDSAGLLNHLGLLGEVLGKTMTMSDFSGELYGKVSDELKGALTGMDVKIYNFYQGL